MISSYLRIAVRNLFKRRGYTILNICGLVIGLISCLLIFQYVSFERSYDTFERDHSQVYRLRLDNYKQGQLAWQSATVYPGIAPALKRDFPEVEDFCRLIEWNGVLANPVSGAKFTETKGYYADPDAVNMLGVNLLVRQGADPLASPNELVISETMAKKYFGTTDVVGKRLEVRAGNAPSNVTYIITGVFRDYPANSHLIINYLVSYATLEEEMRISGDTTNAANTSFGWYDFYTYIKLRKGVDYNWFQRKLPGFCEHHINSQEWNKTNNTKNWLYLIPISDIHLYSNYNQEAEVNGSGDAVAFLFLMGFFIIAIAWINYINLATARSVERAREVGVRKVLGALRLDLIRQFMLESWFLNLIALVISMAAVQLLSAPFNRIMGRDVALSFQMTPHYWFLFAAIFIVGTLLSGLYPAFVLSGYKPVIVLKGIFKNSSGGLSLRKSLIILQFSISVILIVGTIIVYEQVSYMRNQKIGADISQTLVLNGAQSVRDSAYPNVFQPFKNELLRLPGVKGITASSRVMGQEIYWTRGINLLQNSGASPAVTLYILGIDYDFISQYRLNIIAGRGFSQAFPIDATHKTAILNEQAVHLLGFKKPEDALNQKVVMVDTLTIVGVVQNFHQVGLQKPIDPQLMVFASNIRDDYSIKLSTRNMSESVAAIQKLWNKYFPDDPFSYFFLDDYYNQQYKADQQFGNMFTMFSLLALIIACFGLLGLSSYNILQRTKEIGIRKVLGASTQNVVFILSKDFLLLVLVSLVFAVPVSWWVMSNWLQDYAYRIKISAWIFVIAGSLAVTLAMITTGIHAVKAAMSNPVKSLRSE